MKKIVIHSTSFKTFWAHYYVNKDSDFLDRLESLGYKLYQSNETNFDDADIILFSEATSVGLHRFSIKHKIKHIAKRLLGRLNERDVYMECIKRGLKSKLVLCVAEGIVHMPENHVRKLGDLFPAVLTWNDMMVDNKKFLKYCVPQPVRWPEFIRVSYKEKKLLVNISANKYSFIPGELYTSRRNSIRYFESRFKDEFELYGIGWNDPAAESHKKEVPFYPSYKGMVVSKTEVYPKFRFAICYENHRWPGYITEKIFDCMRCDCVPIYLGAPNIKDYVPRDTFIDRTLFSSEDLLASFLENMDEQQYENYRSSISAYLQSDDFKKFNCKTFAENLVRVFENNS